jgi:hypothetical protein
MKTLVASASYTQCIKKDAGGLNRRGGNIEPRWFLLDNGTSVAIRDVYRDWSFITHFSDDQYQYGWVPSNILGKCQRQDGTP